MSKRVVVTGMGVISPLGNSIPKYWDGKTSERIVDKLIDLI